MTCKCIGLPGAHERGTPGCGVPVARPTSSGKTKRPTPSASRIVCQFCGIAGYVATKKVARHRPALFRSVGLAAVGLPPVGVKKRKHAQFMVLACANCGMEQRVQS